jgi:hypothetical protein
MKRWSWALLVWSVFVLTLCGLYVYYVLTFNKYENTRLASDGTVDLSGQLQDRTYGVVSETIDPANQLDTSTVTFSPVPFSQPISIPSFFLPAVDQGRCGSCWAFALCGTLEDRVFVKSNREHRQPLSREYVLNCFDGVGSCVWDTSGAASYCCGGYIQTTLSTLRGDASRAIPAQNLNDSSLFSYDPPYRKPCSQMNAISSYRVWVEGFKHLKGSAEQITNAAHALLQADGPLLATLWVTRGIIRLRFPDIYSPNPAQESWGPGTGTEYHAIEIVWYTPATASRPAYWTIKNSWGTDWGFQGYFNLDATPSLNALGILDRIYTITPVLFYNNTTVTLSQRTYQAMLEWRLKENDSQNYWLYALPLTCVSLGVLLERVTQLTEKHQRVFALGLLVSVVVTSVCLWLYYGTTPTSHQL